MILGLKGLKPGFHMPGRSGILLFADHVGFFVGVAQGSCCFSEDGEETNQIVFCTCSFIVLFINAVVWWRPTWRCRRGFLKLPIIAIVWWRPT